MLGQEPPEFLLLPTGLVKELELEGEVVENRPEDVLEVLGIFHLGKNCCFRIVLEIPVERRALSVVVVRPRPEELVNRQKDEFIMEAFVWCIPSTENLFIINSPHRSQGIRLHPGDDCVSFISLAKG